ncbi:MAG: hypothetical protein K2M74_01265, partial [Bacteroidales bacterium]|nr:hypothetical protein [Bacteroidales bacterium]
TATPFDKTVIAMMIPKGLAAAVLASMPLELGLAGGEFIKNVTYATILFSIMWVSLMILLVDKSRTVRHIFGKLLGGGDSENSNIFVNDVERNASEEDDGMDDRTPFSFISKMEARIEKMKRKEEAEN